MAWICTIKHGGICIYIFHLIYVYVTYGCGPVVVIPPFDRSIQDILELKTDLVKLFYMFFSVSFLTYDIMQHTLHGKATSDARIVLGWAQALIACMFINASPICY